MKRYKYLNRKQPTLEEIRALEKNGTWTITTLLPNKHVGCKWIFSVKHNADGNVERFKARLTGKEFTHVGIMAHYWNGGYTIGMVAILLKRWLTIGMVAILLEWWLYY